MQQTGLRAAELQALSSLFGKYGISVATGEQIVQEHEPSSDLYVILKGAIEFSVEDNHDDEAAKRVLRVAKAGEIFGEIACFTGLPRTATAVATEDSVLLRFQKETAIELIRTSPQFAIRIIQTMADRLKENTEQLTKLWRD